MSSDCDVVTIGHNFWRVPSVRNAFDGWLEGAPTEQERQQVIAKAEADRAAWKPSPEAWEQVEQLKALTGFRIRIQFWDSCMWLMDEEGPFPVEVDCHGVTVLTDGDGFLQAYLQVSNPKEFPTPEGYSPKGYFQQRADCEFQLAPFCDLYQVSKVSA